MKKLVMLVVSFCFVVPMIPVQAAEDLSFLQDLGGVVSKVDNGKTTISFKDGTQVVMNGSYMATTDANGFVFMTDTSSGYLAVSVPDKGVVSYSEQVDLADLNSPMP